MFARQPRNPDTSLTVMVRWIQLSYGIDKTWDQWNVAITSKELSGGVKNAKLGYPYA